MILSKFLGEVKTLKNPSIFILLLFIFIFSFRVHGITPIADFSTLSWNVQPGDTLVFNNQSLNSPTTWIWNFEGGFPSTSNLQNPSTQFYLPGTYSVLLTVSNSDGTDSISKTIFVAPKYTFCTENAFSLTGIVSNYLSPPGNNCQFLISPGCAQDITLSFTNCDIYCYTSPTTNYFDYLYVYDGDNTNAPLILSTTCNNIPPVVTGHSGKLLIYLNGNTVDSHFEASWTSTFTPTPQPNTFFTVSDSAPPLLAPVYFIDHSTVGSYGWWWNFGDGNNSAEQHPTHIYQATGNYLVTLITRQCNGSDTATMNINVQQESALELSDSLFNSSLSCMDSATSNLWLKNTGPGDLTFQFADSSVFPVWLNFSPDSGVVHTGDSMMLAVNFNSYSIQSGNYIVDLNLQTNDTNNLQNILNFSLQSNGSSYVLYSDSCLLFDTLIQHTSKHNSLMVYNIGCDTLFVSSLQFSNTIFSGSVSTPYILSGDSMKINITLFPSLSGNYNDSLTITTNAGVKVVCLKAIVLPAPVISTVNNINYTVDACSNEINGSVVVHNSGGTNLQYKFMQADNYIGPQPRIVLMKDTQNILNSYSNLKNIIQSHPNNYPLFELTLLDSANLTSALASADVFIIPQTNTNVNNLVNISSILEAFVRNGGAVIISGMHPGFSDRILATQLLHGAFGEAYQYSPKIVYPDHPIIRGITSYSTGYQSMQTTNFTDPDIISILKTPQKGTDLLSYRNLERGKIIYYGFRYIYPLPSFHQILFNALEYSIAHEYWLSQDTSTHINIAPGDSLILNYKISTKNLSSGTYSGSLNLHSSDPLQPVKQIITTLTINQKPCTDFYYLPDSCNGKVDFTDKSINEPTSWIWNFGDGSFSTQQNPSHIYINPGIYSVKLITCNSVSCDTASLIVYSVNSPPPACIPNSAAQISNTMRVTFNTLDYYPPLLGRYQDFTCSNSTILTAGKKYTLSAGGNTNITGYLRAWIDFNSDSSFSNSEEIAWEERNSWNYFLAGVIIPHTAVTYTPLRMRLARGGTYYVKPLPCDTSPVNFYQDFTVVVVPDSINPLSSFTYTVLDSCNGVVQFYNHSSNSTSFQWDFGDGETSLDSNPIHDYDSIGGAQYIVSVSLLAINTMGTSVSQQTIQFPYFLPEINIQSIGSLVLCPGNDVLLYPPSSVINTTYPYWIVDDSVIVFRDSSFLLVDSAGSYQIISVNSLGCIDTSAAIVVTEAPDLNIQASPSVGCSGDSIQLSGPLFMQTYNWSTGDTSSSTNVTTSGQYLLNVIVQPACIAYDTIQVMFNTPVQQIVTFSNDSLFAVPGAEFYQWYFNSNAIAGATNAALHPLNYGYYYVVAIDSFGCESISGLFSYLSTNQEELSNIEISIFPNPAVDILTMRLLNNNHLTFKICITNFTGYKILLFSEKEFLPEDNEITLNVASLSNGLYLLCAESDLGIFHFPVLILR